MQMHALSICFLSTTYPHPHAHHTCFLQPIIHPSSSSFPPTPTSIATTTTSFLFPPHSQTLLHANSPNIDSTILFDGDEGKDDDSDLSGGTELQPSVYNNNRGGGSSSSEEGIEIEIEKIGKNSRRIRSRIAIEETELQTVWNILTDYERLADFIPGLAVSQLLEKRPNFARIFQIGQQKLAFGLNFNAKGIVDCYEKDLETLPFGQRRDIEFKMIEGDFQLFEGKWSIEQYNLERSMDSDSFVGQEFHTTLSYIVDVEPKWWLPVHLVEGRLCREIKMNLSCIREEAQKAKHDIPDYY